MRSTSSIRTTIVALVPAPRRARAAALLPGPDDAGGRRLPAAHRSHARTARRWRADRTAEPYSRGLTLDAIGQPTISAGVSEFGGFAGGSVSAFFSDMLGDRELGVGAQVAGSLPDFGGNVGLHQPPASLELGRDGRADAVPRPLPHLSRRQRDRHRGDHGDASSGRPAAACSARRVSVQSVDAAGVLGRDARADLHAGHRSCNTYVD